MKSTLPILSAFLLFAAGAAFAQDGSCAAEIARYKEIVDSDGATGNVAKRVYERIKVEIAAAEQACSAGADAKARALLLASKQRHGYPTGL